MSVLHAGLEKKYMSENDDNRYIFPFEKLEVWRLAIDFADYIFGSSSNQVLEGSNGCKHLDLTGSCM